MIGCYFLYNLITFDVPQNRVTWCCKQTEGNTLQSYNPNEYYNDPVLTDIRESLKQDIKHKNCGECWDSEAKGIRSWRQTEEGIIPSYITNIDDFKKQVTRLEIKLDNTCDLACIYCGPWDSTTWQRENKKHKFYKYNKTDSNIEFHQKILDTIATIAKHNNILELGFVGGEPLLSKHIKDGNFKKFVDAFYKNSSNDALLTLKFVSNANTPKKILSKTLKVLQQTKQEYPTLQINIALSLESTGKYTEFSRYLSDWGLVDSNIQTWLSYKWINVSINTAFNALTLVDIPNYVQYLKDIYTKHDRLISISPNIVYWPEGLTPGVLPKSFKHYIDDALGILSTMQHMFVDDPDSGYDRFVETLNNMSNSLGAGNVVDLLRYINYIEQIRKIDASALIPEVTEYARKQSTLLSE